MTGRFAIIFIALFALATRAMAENVYRCAGTYQQQPCGGDGPLTIQDPRTSEQQLQARQTAQRQAKAAQTLERTRLQAQKAQNHSRRKTPKPRKPASQEKAKATDAPPYFTAKTPVAPAPPHTP